MPTNTPWLPVILSRLLKDKSMAEAAMGQLSWAELQRRPASSFNSVATIVRHVSGNLLSRWTDFLTTDGNKPDRDRDSEFLDWDGSREELMNRWEAGFAAMVSTIRSLTDDDLTKTVTIRGEPHSVPQAIIRSLDHTAYHIGQILLVSRLMHEGQWQFLTIPPGKSREST